MSLSDELHSILTRFREHVAGWANSGQLVTIDGHLDRLAAAAENGVQAADEEAKRVLAELYTALHGAPAPAEPAPVDTAPGPTPVVVGESGPETADLPTGAPAAPADAEPAPVEETTDVAAQ